VGGRRRLAPSLVRRKHEAQSFAAKHAPTPAPALAPRAAPRVAAAPATQPTAATATAPLPADPASALRSFAAARPPPKLDDTGVQTAVDAVSAAAGAAVPKAAAFIDAHPEIRAQVDTLTAAGLPGFNKTALKMSPNDVGTLGQAAAAANTVKTFLKSLPSAVTGATKATPGTAVPAAGVFQTAPSPTGRFTVGSPNAAITFNTGTNPLPAPAAAAVDQIVAAVTPNVEAATRFLEGVLPSPPPPPPAPAATALLAPAAQQAVQRLGSFLEGAADGVPGVTAKTSVASQDKMSTAAFGRRMLAVAVAAAEPPARPTLAALSGVPQAAAATTADAAMAAAGDLAAADAAAAAAAATAAATTATAHPTTALAPAPAPRFTFELPKLPQPPKPAPLAAALALPPATAPTALELDAARPRPGTPGALPAAAQPSPRRGTTLTALADSVGAAFVALSPSLAPALGPLPVSGKVQFLEPAASTTRNTGPSLPEVRVPTARAGTITLPAAALPAPGSVDLKAINPKGDLIWTNPGGGGAGGAASMAAGGGAPAG